MIFRKQSDAAPSYSLDDLRSDIGAAIAKARQARIHPVMIERALKSAADSFAQIRAMMEPAI
jgi:hypothetical protein